MASALFGASGSSRSKNLVEFKAGKMTLKGKLVYTHKLVYINEILNVAIIDLIFRQNGSSR